MPQKKKQIVLALVWMRSTYLPMNKDYRSEQPPRSSLPIHMQHAQDLEETDAPEKHNNKNNMSSSPDPSYMYPTNEMQNKTACLPDGRRGKHLAIGTHAEHNDRCNDHYQICERGKDGPKRKRRSNRGGNHSSFKDTLC